MSGFLEQLVARVEAVEAKLAAMTITPTATTNLGGLIGGQPVQQPVQQPVNTNVDAASVEALITPHLDNDQIKTALGTAMRGLGIQALQDATPAQLPQLYAAFQSVIAAHTGGGVQQSTPNNSSII